MDVAKRFRQILGEERRTEPIGRRVREGKRFVEPFRRKDRQYRSEKLVLNIAGPKKQPAQSPGTGV